MADGLLVSLNQDEDIRVWALRGDTRSEPRDGVFVGRGVCVYVRKPRECRGES